MNIRAYLVDDESLARDRLRQLLSSLDDVDVVGDAGETDEALRGIQELRPDLVFLDVQMPGRTGLELAAALTPPRPSLVFCTAFDEYAIRAFELHALDYLLKPVSRARLAQTVDRIRRTVGEHREIAHDLQSATLVQARMFPNVLPAMDTLDYAGVCRAARSVGGDYYDFLLLAPRTLGIALGDVSGKGVAAALLMASLQGRLQSLAHTYAGDLPGLIRELNRDIWRTTEGSRFITLFYAVYDDATRTLSYVNAGHNPPLLLSGSGATRPSRRLDRAGLVLGCFEQMTIEQETIPLTAGDTLVAFSDGITEARNPADEEFGEARLESLVTSGGTRTAHHLRDRILEDVDLFTAGAPTHDDQTVVVAKVL